MCISFRFRVCVCVCERSSTRSTECSRKRCGSWWCRSKEHRIISVVMRMMMIFVRINGYGMLWWIPRVKPPRVDNILFLFWGSGNESDIYWRMLRNKIADMVWRFKRWRCRCRWRFAQTNLHQSFKTAILQIRLHLTCWPLHMIFWFLHVTFWFLHVTCQGFCRRLYIWHIQICN